MKDSFHAIRPYTEQEAAVALQNIFKDDEFIHALRLFEPNVCIKKVLNEHSNYKTVYDFQLSVAKNFVEYFIDHSTHGVELEGIKNIDPDKSYLFLANHRDIVFDTSLLQYYFMLNRYPTSKIAIGDNLLSTPLLEAIGKINKMITVKRSVSHREKLENYRLLSHYIYHSIIEEKESVWIAQRNGRTKNGIDYTQHGLVKMLSMSGSKQIISTLKELNIVPVTISYEYEACDNLKARELALSEQGSYEKEPGEDFASIQQGLFGQKGRIKLVIGTVLNDELDQLDSKENHNVLIEQVCKLVDKQIYRDYKLYPNNYIAYDHLEESKEFSEFYTEEEKRNFMEYLNKQSVTKDVPKTKMMDYLLQIYANPVKIIYRKITV